MDRKRLFTVVGLSLVALFLAVSMRSFADEDAAVDAPPEDGPVHLLAIDPEGRPVEGAQGGILGYRESDGEKPWKFGKNPDNVMTDANGALTLPTGADWLTHSSIVLMHRERKLVGIKLAAGEELEPGAEIRVQLQPACHVKGRLTCNQLAQKEREIGWTNVYVHRGDERPLGCSSEEGEFEFWLPPGEYELEAHGENVHKKRRPIVVDENAETLVVDAIDLEPTRLALLVGEEAPELRGVSEWIGEPITLKNLQGKYVLLDFWGHWCGPCVDAMPDLFTLREQVSEEKLAIIGVHVDLPLMTSTDTVEKYETAIADIRDNFWNGRDLPFPIVLTKSTPTLHKEHLSLALCYAAADYGVMRFPTTILIDPAGRVVGSANAYIHSKEGRAKLVEVVTGKRMSLEDE